MRSDRSFWVGLMLVTGLFVGHGEAGAHQNHESLLVTEIRPASGEVEQLLSVAAEDVSHHFGLTEHGEYPSPEVLGQHKGEFTDYLVENLMVRTEEEECGLEKADFLAYPGEDGRLHLHLLYRCPREARRVILGNQVLFESHGGYRHRGRIQKGEEIYQTVYESRFPTYTVEISSEVNLGEEGSDFEVQAEEPSKKPTRKRIILALLAAALVGSTLLWLTSER